MECRQYLEVEALQNGAKLYGEALHEWHRHLQSCVTCGAQHSALTQLRRALGEAPAPRLTASFAARTLAAAHHASQPAPRHQLRTRALLVVNWVLVLGVCALAGALWMPAGNLQSHVPLRLAGVFVSSAAFLAFYPKALRQQWF